MFLNREALDCSAREGIIGKDQGLQLGIVMYDNEFETKEDNI